jgi:hypothetical protein
MFSVSNPNWIAGTFEGIGASSRAFDDKIYTPPMEMLRKSARAA